LLGLWDEVVIFRKNSRVQGIAHGGNMNDSDLAEWLDIPLSRIEKDVEELKDELIRSKAYDSRSRVGDTLLRIQGQLEQIRQEVPKPR
jgi:hypothetical protein